LNLRVNAEKLQHSDSDDDADEMASISLKNEVKSKVVLPLAPLKHVPASSLGSPQPQTLQAFVKRDDAARSKTATAPIMSGKLKQTLTNSDHGKMQQNDNQIHQNTINQPSL
jgi:hypothetical protein